MNGLKIRNYQAGSIYEYGLGVRDRYDWKPAMLADSLLKDYLIDNGLEVWHGDFTRDVIGIEFSYGGTSYEEQLRRVDRAIGKAARRNDIDRVKHLQELKVRKAGMKDSYKKVSKQELRESFYRDGVEIEYRRRGGMEKVHYRFLYRTPGKAKKGSSVFIRDSLYEKTLDFIRMGLKLPSENAPVVEMGAYSSLITSAIEAEIRIPPQNILVLEDVESFFETSAVSVEVDSEKHCVAVAKEKATLKNVMFDGQALIDDSVFPEWADGYVLLRQHFCKMAAFHTHIQKFFRDWYGDSYESAEVEDMFGVKHKVRDIVLITTDNAMKWIKFGVSYGYWCEKVEENGSMFGVVKTAHRSKLGHLQQMSYQMVNALDESIMPSVVGESVAHITRLKRDMVYFLDYLKRNVGYCNDYDVLLDLVENNPDFVRSSYFRERRADVIQNAIRRFRNGKLLQEGDNLVLVGSPYAMLLHAVGEDPESDPCFESEHGAIQCFTTRFSDGEYLAEFRNPFNSKNNMGCLHNVWRDEFFRYFDLGRQIIAVNVVHTDFQDRNNGSDFDSDTVYTTNHPSIVQYAQYCYLNYPTIVNGIPKESNSYSDTPEDFARVDGMIASANMAIGESSNLAQISQVYTYNFPDQKYADYVCILSVLAQVAIDSAKRRFDIDLNGEIARIRADLDIDEHGYPQFWYGLYRRNSFERMSDWEEEMSDEMEKYLEEIGYTTKWGGKKKGRYEKMNPDLKCPMNYLYTVKFPYYRPPTSTLPMGYFFQKFPLEKSRRQSRKVEGLIQKYMLEHYLTIRNGQAHELYQGDVTRLMTTRFEELIHDIRRVYISDSYIGLMSWLLDRGFLITPQAQAAEGQSHSRLKKNRPLLLKTLYVVNRESVLKCFSKNLVEDQKTDTISDEVSEKH